MLTNLFSSLHRTEAEHIFFAMAIIVGGYWVSRWSGKHVSKLAHKHMSRHEGVVFQRFVFYGGMLTFIIAAMEQLGFKLGVLLGAAGVFTVGVGFAAQTSLANLISGLFLLLERPFKIGDTITAKGFTGVVDTIDLLSTRLCTSDNTLVRIPNENIMQAEIINLSYFRKRRVDLTIGVAYGTDIEKARKILLQLVKETHLAITDPEPKMIISDFGASAINIVLKVWAMTPHHDDLKYALQEAIKVAFEKEGIEMPFPQMTIHSV